MNIISKEMLEKQTGSAFKTRNLIDGNMSVLHLFILRLRGIGLNRSLGIVRILIDIFLQLALGCVQIQKVQLGLIRT